MSLTAWMVLESSSSVDPVDLWLMYSYTYVYLELKSIQLPGQATVKNHTSFDRILADRISYMDERGHRGWNKNLANSGHVSDKPLVWSHNDGDRTRDNQEHFADRWQESGELPCLKRPLAGLPPIAYLVVVCLVYFAILVFIFVVCVICACLVYLVFAYGD